jgi:hypothetical protein
VRELRIDEWVLVMFPSKQRAYATRYMREWRIRTGITKRPGVLGYPRGKQWTAGRVKRKILGVVVFLGGV